MRSKLAWCLLVLVAASGCRMFAVTPHAPNRNSIIRDQLIIHSDFPIAENDRLLDELVAQRAVLSQRLGLPRTNRPIDVYLFHEADKYDEFTTGVYPDFPKRRAFFVEQDDRLAVYAHWNERVAEDLRHEVSHGYLHAAISVVPLWLDEGVAEFFETPSGGRGLNVEHLQELATAIEREDWRPNLARLEGLSTTTQFSQRDYAESWAWVHFLLETDPQQAALLTGYLAALRTGDDPEPFAQQIRRMHYQPDETLREHILALSSDAQLASRQ